MIITTIVLAIIIIIYLIAKRKPSNQRTVLEKIICSIFSTFHTKLSKAENSIRTAKVMREEAIKEVNDAIRKLKSSYHEGQTHMCVTLRKLKEEILPKLEAQPQMLTEKAKRAKQEYQTHNIETYKQNAIKYLQLKKRATINIKRVKDNIRKLEIAIENSKARYDENITDLEIIQVELESMINIPQIELNNSISRIKSLQTELTDKMNIDIICTEVQNEIQNEKSYAVDSEFEKL